MHARASGIRVGRRVTRRTRPGATAYTMGGFGVEGSEQWVL